MVIPGTPAQQFLTGIGLLVLFLVAIACAVISAISGNWIGFGLLLVAAALLFVAACSILIIAAFNNRSVSDEEEAEAAYDADFISPHQTS
ncbi:MAG: hypothetical protein AAB519_02155 [Patescibacteria group bacterium]